MCKCITFLRTCPCCNDLMQIKSFCSDQRGGVNIIWPRGWQGLHYVKKGHRPLTPRALTTSPIKIFPHRLPFKIHSQIHIHNSEINVDIPCVSSFCTVLCLFSKSSRSCVLLLSISFTSVICPSIAS